MKKVLALTLCVIIAVCVAGCSSAVSIVGTWTNEKNSSQEITYNADGTMTYMGVDGGYTLKDDTLTMEIEAETVTVRIKLIENDRLEIIDSDNSISDVLIRKA